MHTFIHKYIHAYMHTSPEHTCIHAHKPINPQTHAHNPRRYDNVDAVGGDDDVDQQAAAGSSASIEAKLRDATAAISKLTPQDLAAVDDEDGDSAEDECES